MLSWDHKAKGFSKHPPHPESWHLDSVAFSGVDSKANPRSQHRRRGSVCWGWRLVEQAKEVRSFICWKMEFFHHYVQGLLLGLMPAWGRSRNTPRRLRQSHLLCLKSPYLSHQFFGLLKWWVLNTSKTKNNTTVIFLGMRTKTWREKEVCLCLVSGSDFNLLCREGQLTSLFSFEHLQNSDNSSLHSTNSEPERQQVFKIQPWP